MLTKNYIKNKLNKELEFFNNDNVKIVIYEINL